MRVSLGARLRDGPWGGGNLFAKAFVEHLRAQGVDVVHDLDRPDIDVIVLTDPRPRSESAAFGELGIARYLWLRNSDAIVLHRVNECDQRKGTTGVNRRLIAANRLADHTVFISSWLRDLFLAQRLPCAETSVILNGADRRVFHPDGHRPWNGVGPLRLVTHHWGANWRKGFDVYQRLDGLLASDRWRGRIAFTYVGRLPPGFHFANARYVEPLSGEALATELRTHHVYTTASQFEPAGMHHIEGALCGLPLLFRDSGALPEYCTGFGIKFSDEDFEARLDEMVETYSTFVPRLAAYPHDSTKMAAAYLDLIKELVARRGEILHRRDPRRWSRWFFGRVLP